MAERGLMKALILAAGCGTRLAAASDGLPKGLVEVGGMGVLDRQIANLHAHGVERICIVTGYGFAQFEQRFGGRVDYRYNPFFGQSNNMVSFLFARDWIDDDVIVLYADLLYGPDILDAALTSQGDISLLVDRTAIEPGHALVSIREGAVRAIGRELTLEAADARFVGVAKFSRGGLHDFLPELDRAAKAGRIDQYYTVGLAALAARDYPIEAVDVAGRRWREIDTPEDLERARQEWG
jgi:choline kinase